ncbi:hypothetical protein O7Y22_18410, partial [Acinetobacter baumannii]|nr:hypothetical protein [Acinetobacter baumannii]MCZ7506731.1 hypothetical protein [Acinetobacter baumannii]MCZ7510456.1 hypothetical protein [Acinetobacter baumannii]
ITHVRVSHRQLIILNTPISKEVGVFFYMGKQSIKNYLNIELQIIFGCLLGSIRLKIELNGRIL